MQLLELYESYAELMEKKRNGDMVLLSIPNIDHKLKEINTFEHLNGEVESFGFALIDCRSIEDVKSMSPKDLEKSMYYLWIQYMRTRRMKERFVDSMMERPNMHEIGEKTWPFMLFLITSNLWQTGFKKDDARYTIVINKTKIPFITGDQPIINLKDNQVDAEGYAKDCELYYPLSPERALLVSFDKGPKYSEIRKGRFWVKKMNHKIWEHSSYHVFSSNEIVLKNMLLKKDYFFDFVYKYIMR